MNYKLILRSIIILFLLQFLVLLNTVAVGTQRKNQYKNIKKKM